MARVMKMRDLKEVQKNARGDYYILNEEDGRIEVEMLSPQYVVEKGDKDLAGNIWQKDWTLTQVEAMVDGEKKYMSLGPTFSDMYKKFVARCLKNNLDEKKLPGTLWEFEKTGEYSTDVEFKGKTEKDEQESNDSGYEEIKSAVKEMANEPELSQGKTKSEFLSIVGIKTKIPTSDVKPYYDRLREDNVIIEVDGKVAIND